MSFFSDNMLGILIAVIVLLIYVMVKKRLNYFVERGLPYIKPTLYDFYMSWGISVFNDRPVEMYFRSKDVDSPYIGFFGAFFTPSILIKDPSLAEKVLIKDFSTFQDHGFDIDFKQNPLAGHLFNMNGDEWRTLRHKLVPTFTSGKLRGMVPIIEECADKLIAEINNTPRLKNNTNLKELYKRYSLAVIASCAFGIDPESVKDENSEFRRILQDLVNPSFGSRLRFALSFGWPRLSKALGLKIFPQQAEDLMLSLTKDSFEMRKKSGVKRNDFIQLLLELKEKGSVELDVKDLEGDEKESLAALQSNPSSAKLEFTDELLAAQVFVFMVGGFENLAFLPAMTTYILSKHPDIQNKVREEVKQMRDKHGRIDYQALRDMKYLQACIDETLRLYSPAAVHIRQNNKPYTFSDGKTIEKGTQVLLPSKGFQTDTKYWTEPDKFDPDRFLDGNTIQPGLYIPFGDGPRICIAQRLALLVAKLLLAKLVLSYEMLPSPKTKEPIKLKIVFSADAEGGFWGSFKDV